MSVMPTRPAAQLHRSPGSREHFPRRFVSPSAHYSKASASPPQRNPDPLRFLAQIASALGSAPPPLSAEVARALAGYRWPGNLRELRNVMARAAILAAGNKTRTAELLGITRLTLRNKLRE